MRSMTVADLKRDFKAAIASVRKGESILVEYGRGHEEVAVLVPYAEYCAIQEER